MALTQRSLLSVSEILEHFGCFDTTLCEWWNAIPYILHRSRGDTFAYLPKTSRSYGIGENIVIVSHGRVPAFWPKKPFHVFVKNGAQGLHTALVLRAILDEDLHRHPGRDIGCYMIDA